MKSVCAWCKADLGEIKEDRGTAEITHGICEKCVKILLSENSKSMHEFLDSLRVPIIVIESGVKVRMGNKYAKELLGKELSEIKDTTVHIYSFSGKIMMRRFTFHGKC